MQLKHALVAFSMLVLALVCAPSTLALSGASITVTQFSDYSGDCGQTPYFSGFGNDTGVRVDYTLNFTGFTPEPLSDTDAYALIVRDANDRIINLQIAYAYQGLDHLSNLPAGGQIEINTPYNNQYLPGTTQPLSRPWRVEIHDITTFSSIGPGTSPDERLAAILQFPLVGETVIDPAEFSAACEALPYLGSQDADLLNAGVGVLEAQLFEGRDGAGNPAINVYEVNNEGDGAFAFQITKDDVEPFIGNPPAENTELIASVSRKVVLYVLDTGEFQINIGPDENGEVFIYIFDALPPDDVRSYSFNVYDILDE